MVTDPVNSWLPAEFGSSSCKLCFHNILKLNETLHNGPTLKLKSTSKSKSYEPTVKRLLLFLNTDMVMEARQATEHRAQYHKAVTI